jgi:hypothetical protein
MTYSVDIVEVRELSFGQALVEFGRVIFHWNALKPACGVP